MEKVGDELPWDRPKADPDDLDLFEQPDSDFAFDAFADDATRLALARIQARPILEDPPPPVKE